MRFRRLHCCLHCLPPAPLLAPLPTAGSSADPTAGFASPNMPISTRPDENPATYRAVTGIFAPKFFIHKNLILYSKLTRKISWVRISMLKFFIQFFLFPVPKWPGLHRPSIRTNIFHNTRRSRAQPMHISLYCSLHATCLCTPIPIVLNNDVIV